MDQRRFDQLAQALASTKSRRGVLAVTAAGILASLRPNTSAATTGDDCGAGFEFCDGACHYVATSHDHCGSCGNDCGDLVCIDGACATCESNGQTTCYDPIGEANYCADLDTSWNDCGECGNRCTTGPCENGVCVSTADCDEGFTECMGECVDLQSNVFHCGVCSHACMGVPGPGQDSIGMCVEGSCEIICLEGFTACPGDPVDVCADLSSDPEHCGACGNVCANGTCVDGACEDVPAEVVTEESGKGDAFSSLSDLGSFVRLVEGTSLALMRQGLAAFPADAFVGLPNDTRTRLGKIRDHDKAHLQAFEDLPELSVTDPAPEPVFAFADVDDFIARAYALKQATTAAYVLMLRATTITDDVFTLVSEIATVEGRHAAWLAVRSGNVAFTDPTERPLSRAEIEAELAALSA